MQYRKEIDGLRALAVLPVVLFHAGFDWVGGGYIGVDVFFVISGYLITSIIFSEMAAGHFTIIGFYERRVRRILPALFLVTIACIPLAWTWMLSNQLEDFAKSVLAVALFASNILFWRQSDYFAAASDEMPLLHTWTLAVEEQFYVVFPIFILLTWRLGTRRLIWLIAFIALFSLGLAEYGSWNYPSASYYLAPTRAWELMLGALAAFAWMNARLRILGRGPLAELISSAGLALIVFSVFAYGPYTRIPGLYALAPTIGAVLVILFATQHTIAGRLLSWPPFVGGGLISYSIYLWHLPLFAFARIRTTEAPGNGLMVMLILATLALGYATWRWIEMPFRDRKNFSRNKVFSAAAVVTSSLIAMSFAGIATNGFEMRMPERVRAELSIIEYHAKRIAGDCNIERDYRAPETSCILGDHNATPSVALWGDSHAEMHTEALGNAIGRLGKSARQFTADACLPFSGVRTAGAAVNVDCVRQTALVKDYLLHHPDIETVIFAARWTAYLAHAKFDNGEGGVFDDRMYGVPLKLVGSEEERQEAIRNIIKRGVKEFLEAGKRVVLVYPVPEAGWNIPQMAAKKMSLSKEPIGDISTDYERQKVRNAMATAALDSIGEHPRLLAYPA